MIFRSEKQLIKIIKFTPSVFIILISLLLIAILFFENKKTFEKEKRAIEQEFIQKNKQLIKEEVDSVYNYIINEQKNTHKELENSLKEALNNAHSIAYSLYINNLDKPKKEVEVLITDALRHITFNKGRGYFFIYEKSGRNVMLPYSPHLEGKDFINHQDAKGTYIIQEVIELLKHTDETFYEWYWFKPNDTVQQRKKVGYYRNFEPLDWFIGTGEYIEDFEKEVQQRILSNINQIRYGENGYIFVIDYDSIYLSHIRQKYIGQNAVANNDTVDIKKVIDDLITLAKRGEGYYSYIQNKKPDNNLPVKKISYVKGLENWSWMIGSGFYVDDVNNDVEKRKSQLNEDFKNYMSNTIQIALFLTFILLLFSVYFSDLLQKKFLKYKTEINQHIQNNEKQQTLLSQQSKMAAMGEMIGNIAHQWRQPLSTITTSATGMQIQKELNILEDNDLIKGLDTINKSAQYLSHTIDDFRNFFTHNKQKSYFNIKKSIQQAISLVSVQFYKKNIEIIENIDEIEVNSYENELIQVIINLLNNARDELIKKEENERKLIFITAKKENESLIITVKDNASGIPFSIIKKIFDPYFSTKDITTGTGIGLYMSKEIICKNMGGTIEAKNEKYIYDKKEHLGAVFTITLPLNKEA
ncbi:MAG: cache domain-containing protein [Arcobacteraceae bacterium]